MAKRNLRQLAEQTLDAGYVPNGDQIYDLIRGDRLAGFMWWRCIDWVLWRQRQGLPVLPMSDDDSVPAAINARFDAAHAAYRNIEQWPRALDELDIAEICNHDILDAWQRGGAPHPDTVLMCEILDALDTAE